ncbi:MAG: hypothetical protein OER92_11435, partial [Alphaproteobacteria bacterium]|nr:hypothetical protein [Alphaproteobacteria bacterium]
MPKNETERKLITRRVAGLLALLLSAAAISQDAPNAGAEYSRSGADTCLACHDDTVTAAIFRNAHGVPGDTRTPFGSGQLQCEACHGPGGDHAGRVRRGEERPPVIRFGQDTETPVSVQNGMCLGCHDGTTGFGWHG